jgi:hypothetical protein
MRKVISDLASFEKDFPNLPKKGERMDAIKTYFSAGGVIKIYDSEKDWPKLAYPSYFVLEKKMKELKEKKGIYEKKKHTWDKQHKAASQYHARNQIKKLKEPLFWKHKAKMTLDRDYKKDANSVKLPVHLVGDDRWKPMVKMFVNDLDYRKQLAETVDKSIVYRKNKKVAQYADDLKDFRMGVSGKQITDLTKKLDKLNKIEIALRELQKWAKE